MVGIFVDDDVVAIPEPVVAEAEIVRRDAEIEAAEPEAAGTASREMPDVAAAEASGEVTVFPGMVEVIVNVVVAGPVADPFPVRVDVRCVGMSDFVVVVRGRRGWMRCRLRTVGRDISGSANRMMLCEGQDGKQEAKC